MKPFALPVAVLATIVLPSWTGAASPAASGPPSGNGSFRPNPETDRCLKEAAKEGTPPISIAIRKMSQAGDFIRVEFSITNVTDAPIWMNVKPFACEGSGLAADQQMFVTVQAPWKRTGRGFIYDVDPVPPKNYEVIEPHKRRDLIVPVNGIGFDLSPGTYRVDACFWDRNRKIPKAPNGAAVVRGPVGVSQVVPVAH
jgi:hypothetical protein